MECPFCSKLIEDEIVLTASWLFPAVCPNCKTKMVASRAALQEFMGLFALLTTAIFIITIPFLEHYSSGVMAIIITLIACPYPLIRYLSRRKELPPYIIERGFLPPPPPTPTEPKEERYVTCLYCSSTNLKSETNCKACGASLSYSSTSI